MATSLKSLADLRVTPEQITQQVTEDMLSRVLRGLVFPGCSAAIRTEQQLFARAASCGRGEHMVKSHPLFNAARWLLSK